MIVLLALVPISAMGAPDKYKITTAEKLACTADAVRLCSGAYPNEDQLLACMKQNRSALSATCLVAFDTGVKRRHL